MTPVLTYVFVKMAHAMMPPVGRSVPCSRQVQATFCLYRTCCGDHGGGDGTNSSPVLVSTWGPRPLVVAMIFLVHSLCAGGTFRFRLSFILWVCGTCVGFDYDVSALSLDQTIVAFVVVRWWLLCSDLRVLW